LADNGAGRLAVTKSGTGLWILSGANTNSGDIAVTGGTLRFNITSGTPTIAAGVTATVAGGATLELAGSVSALGTAGGHRAHVINSSTAPGVLVSGTNQVVGSIDGAGITQLNAGSDLTADHIIQAALIIGGSAGSPAIVTIAGSDSSGNPLGAASTLAMAGSLTSSNPSGDGISLTSSIDGLANADLGSAASLPTNSIGGVGSSTVPEPSTMLLFILAMAGLAARKHTLAA
jgi:autotransporter-associated beta strand protein